MEKIIEFLTNDAVLKVLVTAILAAWGAFKLKKLALDDPKNAKKKKAIEMLEVIVSNLYHNEVRELKKAKADGKLTKDEIKAANDKAIAQLKTEAKEKGLDVAKLFGEAYLPVLINKVVGKLKGKK